MMNATTEKSSGVRVYSAQEMRVRADYEESANANTKTAAMLRQAADMMEREKRYEYSFRYYLFKPNGERIRCTGKSTFSSFNIENAKEACYEHNGRHCTVGRNAEKAVLVRREVGEWEEVVGE